MLEDFTLATRFSSRAESFPQRRSNGAGGQRHSRRHTKGIVCEAKFPKGIFLVRGLQSSSTSGQALRGARAKPCRELKFKQQECVCLFTLVHPKRDSKVTRDPVELPAFTREVGLASKKHLMSGNAQLIGHMYL
jgi:hypothetical protein